MKKVLILALVLTMMAVSVAAAENMTGEGSTEAAALVEQAFKLLDAEDYDAAIPLFQEAADMGDASAQNALGNCYGQGLGVEQSAEEAIRYYQLAADQGYAAAQCNLGFCFLYGLCVEQDAAKAIEWFEKAAEQGDEMTMVDLGAIYYYGDGVEQDYAKAKAWFEEAAALGNATAMFNLGTCISTVRVSSRTMRKRKNGSKRRRNWATRTR